MNSTGHGRASALVVAVGMAALTGGAFAQDDVAELGVLRVMGEREVPRTVLSDAPEALPAQTYVIGEQQIEAMPYARATDLFRSTPGMTFGSSSPGSDIGDDISIRGFSSYHGADAAVYVDGVPVNWGHGPMRHGFVDLNWLIPEMIERIEVIKGPFSAEYGNFNLSGAINIITKNTTASSAGVEAGSYDNYRLVGTYGAKHGKVTPMLAYEFHDLGGYRDHSDYRRVNAFNKFSFPVWDGQLSLRLSASQRESDGAGFLVDTDVRNGLIDRRSAHPDALNDGGENDNYAFVANYVPNDTSGIRGTFYVGRDRIKLIDTAFGGDTGVSQGDRNYAGWRVSRAVTWGERALVTIGTDGQVDDGSHKVGGYNGAGGIGTISRHMDVKSENIGIFAQGQYLLLPTLKLIGGLRYDYLRADIDNKLFDTSGDDAQNAVSPKIGIAWAPHTQVELFANYGKGFRSPAHTEMSPSDDAGVFNDRLDVAELVSADIGVTLRPRRGVNLTAAYFTTTTKDELRRDPGDPFGFINVGETDRDGYELMLSWLLSERISLTASHTAVDTRISNPATPGADHVVTVPDDTQTLTLSWRGHLTGANLPVSANLFVQRIGDRPMTANGDLVADPQVIYGLKLGASRGQLNGFVQMEYAPDKYVSDFVFDAGGGGILYDPNPEISLLTGIRYTFN